LTEKHYLEVMKIREDEKKVQKGELENLKKQRQRPKKLLPKEKDAKRQLKLKAKEDAEAARKEGTCRKKAI